MLVEIRAKLIELQKDFDAYSLGARWNDQRFDYTSGDLDYRGANETHNAVITSESWYIWKYTYSGGDLVRIEGPLTGSWDGRASLGWA